MKPDTPFSQETKLRMWALQELMVMHASQRDEEGLPNAGFLVDEASTLVAFVKAGESE